MANRDMVILTAKSAGTILEVGGTQSWVLNSAHAKRCRYAVLCQNAHTDWGDGPEPHGNAFMVGRICDIVPSTEAKGRWLIKFTEYAVIDLPDAWRGWRNPVRYMALKELGIDPGKLKFRPMPAAPKAAAKESGVRQKGLTIPEAKRRLSLTFGVPPETIEITIRG